MPLSLKQAAEELLKVAEAIENDAAEVTQFVCVGCNHTATLAKINSIRKEAASKEKNVVVAEVTAEDKIACPACGDAMAFKATEASAPYYVDEKKAGEVKGPGSPDGTGPMKDSPACPLKKEKEETVEAKKDGEEDEEDSKEASAPIDYDSLERYSSIK